MHLFCLSFSLFDRLIDLNFLLLRDLPLEIGQQLRILRLEILHNQTAYFPFLHFFETLLMAKDNLQKRVLIHRFSFVDLGDSKQQRGDEIVEHLVVKLL